MDTAIDEIRQMVFGISQVEMMFFRKWLTVIIAATISSTNVAELAQILAHLIVDRIVIYISQSLICSVFHLIT